MKNFTILLLSGLLLALIVITQTLSRYSNTMVPFMNLFSERTGIWFSARNLDEKAQSVHQSWLFSDEVKLTRNSAGVVHISAKNETDAYIAWGYALARDRFFQLQFLNRLSSGRLSEMIGKDGFSADAAFLELGLEAAVEKEISTISEDEYALLRSFSAGINLYISELEQHEYPIEFKVLNLPITYWRPADCLRILKLWEYLNGYSLQDLEHQIVAKKLEKPDIFAELYGINLSETPENEPGLDPVEMIKLLQSQQQERDRWLPKPSLEKRDYSVSVPPDKMQRAQGLFLAFTTGGLTMPSLFYEVRISTPRFEVYGFSLAGAPLMVSGFTRNVAWSFNRPWIPPVKFRYAGADPSEIRIQSKTAKWKDADGRTYSKTYHYSELGPVTRSMTSEIYCDWTAFRSKGASLFFKSLLYAKKADSTINNVELPVLSASISLTDRSGRQFTRALQHQPAVKKWGIEKLPPVSSKQETVRTEPYEPTQSEKRLRDLLNSKSKNSLDDVLAYSRDVTVASTDIKRIMLSGMEELRDKEWTEISQELKSWNFQATADSRVMPLIHTFTSLMRKYTWDEFFDQASESLPVDAVWIRLCLTNPNHPIFDMAGTGERETAKLIVERALTDALRLNVIEFGPYNSWSWGAFNTIKPALFAGILLGKQAEIEPFPMQGYYSSVIPSFGKDPQFGFTQVLVVEFRQNGTNAFVCSMGGGLGFQRPNERFLQVDQWIKRQYRPAHTDFDGNVSSGKTVILKPFGS